MIGQSWMGAQLWQLSVALLAGFGLGFFYDLYRGMLTRERRFQRDYWWRDLLFGLCASLLSLLLWFGLTDGSLRTSVFIWMAAAALFYRWLLSPLLHPESWLRNRTRNKAHRQKSAKRRKAKKTKRRWNEKAARKAILGWQHMQRKLHRQKKEEAEEKI